MRPGKRTVTSVALTLVFGLLLYPNGAADVANPEMPITGGLCQDERAETATLPPGTWGSTGNPSPEDYEECLAGSTTSPSSQPINNPEDQGTICYSVLLSQVPTLCLNAWVGSQRTGHTHECEGMSEGQVCLQFAMYYEAISAILQSGEGHGKPHHGAPGSSNPGSLRNDVCTFTATIPECSDTALGHMGMVPATDPECATHHAWAKTTSAPLYGGNERLELTTDCETVF